jgi:GTP cyclohydrolase I
MKKGNEAELLRMVFESLWPGINWEDEHHKKTPERVIKMWEEQTASEDFEFTTFADPSDEMVIVKDITFNSVCAHHLLPFVGIAHVAYIPDGKLCGLSKLARAVRQSAAALQVQENLTAEIAKFIEQVLRPKGVAVVMEAEHHCMTVRGVRAAGASTITSKMTGVFLDPSTGARAEFLNLIK